MNFTATTNSTVGERDGQPPCRLAISAQRRRSSLLHLEPNAKPTANLMSTRCGKTARTLLLPRERIRHCHKLLHEDLLTSSRPNRACPQRQDSPSRLTRSRALHASPAALSRALTDLSPPAGKSYLPARGAACRAALATAAADWG